MYVSAVDVYETYRPGACIRMSLRTTTGGRVLLLPPQMAGRVRGW